METSASPELRLWRLKTELRAYTSNVAAELLQHGAPAAPWGLLAFAKWLGWNASHLDNAPVPAGEGDRGPSAADIAEEIRKAVLPHCAPQIPAPTPTFLERIARLESDCANLREVLSHREGSAQ